MGAVLSLPHSVVFRAQYTRTDGDYCYTYASGRPGGVVVGKVDAETHTVWDNPVQIYRVGTRDGDNAFGIWVSPDRSYLFQCYVPYSGDPNNGVTKWTRNPDGTYSRTGWQNNSLGAVIDVDMGHDGTYLWVTANTAAPAIYRLDAETGSVMDSMDVVTWGLMCSADAVSNVAVTFGKNTPHCAIQDCGLPCLNLQSC